MGEQSEKPAVRVDNSIGDFTGFGKVSERFFAMVQSGLGPIFSPVGDRWRNFHQRKDTDKAIEQMRAEGLAPTSAELTIDGRTNLRMKFESLQVQQRREAIAVGAAIEMPETAAALPPPDQDDMPEIEGEWIDHYWDLAGRISSKGKQVLWSRILSRAAFGQVISARTLTLLSTLSGEEARELERLAQYLVALPEDGRLVSGIFYQVARRQLSKEKQTLLDTANIELVRRSKSNASGLFAAIGILLESGFAFGFHQRPKNGVITFEVAGERFSITGNVTAIAPSSIDSHGFVSFGSGVGISPIGREIFDLISAQPDPDWLPHLAAAFSAHDWQLLDKDGNPISR